MSKVVVEVQSGIVATERLFPEIGTSSKSEHGFGVTDGTGLWLSDMFLLSSLDEVAEAGYMQSKPRRMQDEQSGFSSLH
jgi:hypothetical protein